MEKRIDLFGQTLESLQALCEQENFPKFTAKQLCDWLYVKAIDSIDGMTNLSLKMRERLNEIAYIGRNNPVEVQESSDGTKKYLFWVGEKSYVESVFIPDNREDATDRATLCISCQVGCRMGCRFCNTGRQGFHGNLTVSQILNQIFSIPERDELTNIVYMGMGEPMDNYDAVLGSIQIMTAKWGRAWSPRRITVSSVGITPQIHRLLQDSECHLAISLHDAFPGERAELMPMQRVYPIGELISLLKKQNWYGQRRLSFEYTMLQGVNDDITHAAEIAKLLGNLRCRVNLIRYHATPDSGFETATPASMNTFRDYLTKHGIICTIRASRGEDIMAACGLLAGKKCNEQQ
jgi:23S rRNA (adenine2503-C2)-methyltransferase